MPKTFYITTAIDYTNSPPHIGHAYEKVLADVIARYRRLKDEKVFFLTGVDQHGQKVQQSAAKAGVAPSEFVKGVTQKFVDLWKKLDVKYDGWAETIAPRHKKVVQGMLQRLFDAGQIYKDKQSGFYSVRQEQFLTDKERGPDGEFGPEWGQVEFREEENYYFKLGQHKDWLLRYIDNRKDAVIPDFRQTELRNAIERISGDLCISRPKSRLDWGIELPFDKEFVTYVWFDALTNYISFADYDPSVSSFNLQPASFLDRWPALQIIGKDILVPAHGIYWLIMLHAIGFPDEAMPQLLVHGWWNLGGAKMSKSLGNIVDPNILADKYSPEAVRYYLMSDIVMGRDADFSEERLVTVFNSQLSNALGNLLNRTIGMADRFSERTLKASARSQVSEVAAYAVRAYDFCMSQQEIGGQVDVSWRGIEGTDDFGPLNKLAGGLGNIISFVRWLNQSVEQKAPWKMAKTGESNAVKSVLYEFAESLRIIGILISPVLPKAAHGIFDQLNWKVELSGKEERFALKDAEWGKLPDGHVVGKPVPLFPRIEPPSKPE
ncbi:MAG TPA: class I tRNA ligase family protein [Chthoniobacterales bacterium]|jgi:methionyl-tRNA synthetase|nr:class I tRNA ligase family protein [Chthoniobacterales bacterium]